MIELRETNPEISVLDAEYARLLGYPPSHALEGRALELAQWAREWYRQHGRPWVYARQVGNLEIRERRVRIEGVDLSAKRLYDRIAGSEAHSAIVAVVSAGAECEAKALELWHEGKPDEYFFLEVLGSAVVEHLIASLGHRLCAWGDREQLSILPHDSPGYPGWEVSEQAKLFGIICSGGKCELPGRLEILDTGMPRPKKSLLAVFGVTTHREALDRLPDLVPCHHCPLPSCQYRRAPYVRVPASGGRQLSDKRPATNPGIGEANGGRSSPYSISVTALKKWSSERLRLKFLKGGMAEARFLYQGTTCSNLGRPLEFVYEVRLRRAGSSFTIENATCRPSIADTGHKEMCEFQRRGPSLLEGLAAEAPLIGMPLEDVFSWERPFSPAGCFCEATSRMHKWGLVYEVIHFALAHTAMSTTAESIKAGR